MYRLLLFKAFISYQTPYTFLCKDDSKGCIGTVSSSILEPTNALVATAAEGLLCNGTTNAKVEDSYD
jgi:hypothetical protein